MAKNFKDWPRATQVTGSDLLLVDQGTPPTTRTATVDQVLNPGGNVSYPQLTITGQVFGSSGGTAAFPSYSYIGDTDTGQFSPTVNTLSWSVGGIEKLRLDAIQLKTQVSFSAFSASSTYTIGTDPDLISGAQIVLSGSAAAVNPNILLFKVASNVRMAINPAGVELQQNNTAFSGIYGASSSTDAFTTDTTRVIHHYSLSWKVFSDNANPAAALSGFGGFHVYTAATRRFSCKGGTGDIVAYNPLIADDLNAPGGLQVSTGGIVIGKTWASGGAYRLEAVGASIPLHFAVNGTIWGKLFTDGRVSFNGLHNNGTVAGTAEQFLASGSYTPSLTPSTNVSATSSGHGQWTRLGNVVTVSGNINVTCTAATTFSAVQISLPIASTFGDTTKCSGTGVRKAPTTSTFVSAAVIGQNSNNTAQMEWYNDADTGSSREWRFTFTYEVL